MREEKKESKEMKINPESSFRLGILNVFYCLITGRMLLLLYRSVKS